MTVEAAILIDQCFKNQYSRVYTTDISKEEWFSPISRRQYVIEKKENDDIVLHHGVMQTNFIFDEDRSMPPALELMINPAYYCAATIVNGSPEHLIWTLKNPWFFEDGPLALKERK